MEGAEESKEGHANGIADMGLGETPQSDGSIIGIRHKEQSHIMRVPLAETTMQALRDFRT